MPRTHEMRTEGVKGSPALPHADHDQSAGHSPAGSRGPHGSDAGEGRGTRLPSRSGSQSEMSYTGLAPREEPTASKTVDPDIATAKEIGRASCRERVL